jgi:DNA-directed RNA polymerase subunit omega
MDIISLPIEYDKKKIDGNYRLVIAAVKRAKDLSQGVLPKIKSKAKKITTLALEEVALGAVNIITGEAAAKANEEKKKLVHKRMMDEAQQKETMPEDLTELEKDLKVYLSEKTESEQKRSIEDIFGDGQ